MHKKICPRGNNAAQPLTFVLHPENLPEVPVRAVRRCDGYGNSGVQIMYSNHLGLDALVHVAMFQYSCESRAEARDCARNMHEEMYAPAVTSPVAPDLMKLKPGEACFNIRKHRDVYDEIISNGIISDTGKRVQIGYYPERFPICRIHAPQHDNVDEAKARMKAQKEILAKKSITAESYAKMMEEEEAEGEKANANESSCFKKDESERGDVSAFFNGLSMMRGKPECQKYTEDSVVPLTEEEYNRIAYPHPKFIYTGALGLEMLFGGGFSRGQTFHAPDGKAFTVRQLAEAFADAEKEYQHMHHCFYEGFCLMGEPGEHKFGAFFGS